MVFHQISKVKWNYFLKVTQISTFKLLEMGSLANLLYINYCLVEMIYIYMYVYSNIGFGLWKLTNYSAIIIKLIQQSAIVEATLNWHFGDEVYFILHFWSIRNKKA